MEDQFSKITSLLGDPVRSKIMWALLDGRAYTATELAVYADTSPQNMSMHLQKLVEAELLSVEKQGRHRYYNYARPDIAFAIEALAGLLPKPETDILVKLPDAPIRYCRSCYDHLAGKVGVTLTDSLVKKDYITNRNGEFEVSTAGSAFFSTLDIDIVALANQKRSFARACLDWSERKPHLAGSLGAALMSKMVQQDWLRKTQNSRAITLTGKGRAELYRLLQIDI